MFSYKISGDCYRCFANLKCAFSIPALACLGKRYIHVMKKTWHQYGHAVFESIYSRFQDFV